MVPFVPDILMNEITVRPGRLATGPVVPVGAVQ